MGKATVTLDGIPLAANTAASWRFMSGVKPYTTVLCVHTEVWERRLSRRVGEPLDLEITDHRDQTITIKDVYILHENVSDSPYRTYFTVADKRWKWPYKLIVRDYNVPRKTGNRTALQDVVPVNLRGDVAIYDFLPYSLNDGKQWTSREAVEDILELLEPSDGKRIVESWPIESEQVPRSGTITLQNITLRDQGDVALSRVLASIPGADVYINKNGEVVVFDSADLKGAEKHLADLPETTYAGDHPRTVDRKKIRPKRVLVHYQREVEVVFEFDDDLGSQTSSLGRSNPYVENVIPTVDPETEITTFDPETNTRTTKTVPPGTWVPVKEWLAAMQADAPNGSWPWTFETIRKHWLKGDLEGALGAKGIDMDPDANIAMRVQALKQNFRQTFRINKRYMERVRDLLAVRVALLDPITGARAPAVSWGQYCVVPSSKGKLIAGRSDEDKAFVYRNVDTLYLIDAGAQLIKLAPSPANVSIVDKELGVFRLDFVSSPYGTDGSFIPCHLVGNQDYVPLAVSRNLALQDLYPMGAGMTIDGGATGIFLRKTLRARFMLSIIPAAPNNKRQFHIETVEAKDIAKEYRAEFAIEEGEGPDLEVFVAPGELTARFAWQDFPNTGTARETIKDLLGLDSDNPNDAGIDDYDLKGFVLVNDESHLTGHAKAIAAEALAAYADGVLGNISTVIPRNGNVQLKGNMNSATVRVSAAPSAKVDVVHSFPSMQRPISRLALLPDSARVIVLGTLPFKE